MKKKGRRDEQHNVAFREEIVKSDWLTWCWRTAKKSDSKKNNTNNYRFINSQT